MYEDNARIAFGVQPSYPLEVSPDIMRVRIFQLMSKRP